MRYVAAVLVFLASLAGAVYVGVFVLILGGIADIVNGAKHNPTQAGRIFWGVVQITPLAELCAVLIIAAGIVLACAISGRDLPRSLRRRMPRGSFGRRGF